MTDFFFRQQPVWRHNIGRAIGALAASERRETAEAVLCQIIASEDRNHARRGQGRLDIEPADSTGRVLRAEHSRRGHAGDVDVRDVPAFSGQEAPVFKSANGLSETAVNRITRCCCGRIKGWRLCLGILHCVHRRNI